MTVLVIAEHNNHQIFHTTANVLQAAVELQAEVKVLVAGYQCQSVAEEVATYQGVTEVLLLDQSVYEHQLAENLTKVISGLAPQFNYVLAPADTFGKNLLPRVAGLLELGMISDVIKIIDQTTFLRPIYAGNAIAKVESLDAIKLMTIRATAFGLAPKGNQQAVIHKLQTEVENKQSTFIKQELTESDRPDLMAAKIVVSGGRGFQNADNFKLLEQLAKQLGAAIGASRAAVDAGFVPNDYQVGQTGKVVAPELYIAVGISGAIQHIAGMKESKVVVAINKDPEAPIFDIADYGLVGDLFAILPELQHELTKIGYTTQ